MPPRQASHSVQGMKSLTLILALLSTAWGLAIVAVGLSRVAAAAIDGHTTRRLPEILLGLVIPGAIILYMLKFSKSYPDRVTHHSQPAQAPANP